MSDNQKQFLILYWWIHEEIMEWKCVCAALVNAFTNLWRWFYLWRHSEQSLNNRFNEGVTNRAEYLFTFKNPSDNWRINMACKTPNETFFFVSVIVCLGHFVCFQMWLNWPTDDSDSDNRTWRRNLKPGPFKILEKLIFVPECCKIECLPDAYWTARALLKTRCARLKTDSWSNHFLR